jgi:hypothetical protein
MRNLTKAELAGIAQRAELTFAYGDRTALRAEDVADLIQEVREMHALRDHLLALNRQARDQLASEVAMTWGRSVPAVDLLEADPP